MSINVDLFTMGIFKVRFVYSCSDSSYSHANDKPQIKESFAALNTT